MNNLASIQEKRVHLKEISQPLKNGVFHGQIATINEGLLNLYKQKGHSEFKTFKMWKKDGFSVKKGEKAFLLWGQPVRNKKKDEETQTDTEFEFFPISFVFSNLQVERRNK